MVDPPSGIRALGDKGLVHFHVKKMPSEAGKRPQQTLGLPASRTARKDCLGFVSPLDLAPSAVLPDGSRAETLHPSSCKKYPRALRRQQLPDRLHDTGPPEGLGPTFMPTAHVLASLGREAAHPARLLPGDRTTIPREVHMG